MIKQLRKAGNSSALIFTPVQPKSVSPQQFEQALSRVIARRRGVLKRLAQ